MIAVTLAGESNRFFSKGYTTVKYKLPFKGKSIIENILESFPKEEKLLVILNEKFNDTDYFNKLLTQLNFKFFKLVEISTSLGQLDSLVQGLEACKEFYSMKDPLLVYNGDTIRKSPFVHYNCDGYIECFIELGNHWSFVDKLGSVSFVTEKTRISGFCSTGLYGFKHIQDLLYYSKLVEKIKGEVYIAPIYNLMIRDGKKVFSSLSDRSLFTLCGTPEEYETAIND